MPESRAGRDLGLYPAADFRVTTGAAATGLNRQGAWYFRDETIAVPIAGRQVLCYTPGVRSDADLRAWVATPEGAQSRDYPPLVWLGAPDVVSGACLVDDASQLAAGTGNLALALTPKIPLNRSYFDASSAQFFATRSLKVRGSIDRERIVARTLWPEDFRLRVLPALCALPRNRRVAQALRDRMRADPRGGAQSPFAAETMWRRQGMSDDLPGRAVIGIMANGAQGDDDEAHAGHFALVTGRVEDDGAIGDWLVNNFYTLDTESEKGILAAPVPLDNYLADLNAGQGWYRPSYMLVAVLSDDRAAALLQAALGRIYNQFWRHQIAYYHPTTNCTSVSVDALDALGFRIKRRGASSRLQAILGFPWLILTERSLAKAMLGVDYLWTEQTRMLPAAAFEEIGARLFALAAQPVSAHEERGVVSTMLASDLDALVYLQFPQFPSSRAWGDAPVATLREYRQRLPRDPSKLKVVPVPARPFPATLRDPDLLPPPLPASESIAAFWAIVSLVGIPWIARRWWRRRQARMRARPLR